MAKNEDNNQKRNLKKTSGKSGTSMLDIHTQKPSLLPKIDNMLDKGIKYDYIVDFCNEQGFPISKSTLSKYKEKLHKARDENLDIGSLLDGRAKKGKIIELNNRDFDRMMENEDPRLGKGNGGGGGDGEKRSDKMMSHLEYLEAIIEKSFNGVEQIPVLEPKLGMDAVKLYASLTDNQLGGLSIAGLRHIMLKQKSIENAVYETLMNYVPESQHEQLFEDMEKAKQEFIESMDLSEQDKKAEQALEQLGIDLDIK